MTQASLRVTRDRHWISPYFFSVFVTLKEKGLAFDIEGVNLHEGAQRQPGYATSTITARVPALFHRTSDGEFVLGESSAIVEYLEDVFPAPGHRAVLPSNVRDRARARQIMAWIRSDDTLAIREHRSTTTMFYERSTSPLPEAAKSAADKLLAVAGRLVTTSAPLFGEFTIADADLAFMLMRLVMNGDPVPDTLARYARHVWERPTVKEFVDIDRPAFIPY